MHVGQVHNKTHTHTDLHMHVGQVHNKTHTHTDLFCLEWRGYGRSVGSLELGTKT